MSLMIFAERMKQTREKMGLKQKELAQKIYVTPTTISAYEKSDTEGNGKKPTLENAVSIAKALNVSLDWLAGLSDNQTSEGIEKISAKKLLFSIVTVLLCDDIEVTDGGYFAVKDTKLKEFINRVSDLIKIYMQGSLTDDLFNICIDKIVNDFSPKISIEYRNNEGSATDNVQTVNSRQHI